MTLLHYIAVVVKEKYPELANFFNELHFVDKAAAGEYSAIDLTRQDWDSSSDCMKKTVHVKHSRNEEA
jgi:hypothetical protein